VLYKSTTMSHSTRRRRPRHHQSAKPYPDFPLTAHPSGRWCKKVRSKLHYFGYIADGHEPALDLWLKQKDELLAGRVPREPAPEGVTLRDLANKFGIHKKALLDAGELSPRTYQDCYRTCESLIDHFGKERLLDDFHQEDFATYRVALAKRLGPVALGNEIQRVRSVFKFAFDTEMIAAPVRFGPGFKRPTKKVLRLQRAKKGPRLFTPIELHMLMGAAGAQVKCMILLACNAGLGNNDLANLPISALNLDTGWCDYPREKTAVERKFPLWPETIEAIREVLQIRPTPKDEAQAQLLFVTRCGQKWARMEINFTEPNKPTMNNDSAIGKEFTKLFKVAGIERRGRGFYTLRHTFRTIADESRDQVACDHIMGHTRDDMASVYRERISDERLQAVVNHVHAWLFPAPKKDKAEGKELAATVE
jgi:integrase